MGGEIEGGKIWEEAGEERKAHKICSGFPGGLLVKNPPAYADVCLVSDLGRYHMPWSN